MRRARIPGDVAGFFTQLGNKKAGINPALGWAIVPLLEITPERSSRHHADQRRPTVVLGAFREHIFVGQQLGDIQVTESVLQ